MFNFTSIQRHRPDVINFFLLHPPLSQSSICSHFLSSACIQCAKMHKYRIFVARWVHETWTHTHYINSSSRAISNISFLCYSISLSTQFSSFCRVYFKCSRHFTQTQVRDGELVLANYLISTTFGIPHIFALNFLHPTLLSFTVFC